MFKVTVLRIRLSQRIVGELGLQPLKRDLQRLSLSLAACRRALSKVVLLTKIERSIPDVE